MTMCEEGLLRTNWPAAVTHELSGLLACVNDSVPLHTRLSLTLVNPTSSYAVYTLDMYNSAFHSPQWPSADEWDGALGRVWDDSEKSSKARARSKESGSSLVNR